MSDTLQKGWLTTRDGQLYAPATLVENVYTRSGKPYDERVREYIQSLKSSETTNLASIQASLKEQGDDIKALEDKTAYFNGDASDKLFIIDSVENIIAYIDGAGVHSVDFDIPNLISLSGAKQSIDQLKTDLTTLDSEIDTRLQNFNGNEDGNTLFIIDSQENVIAYIDADGIHTTKVSVTEGISDESNEAIFFIDQNENAVAYINGVGVHSVDFLIDDENGATVYALKSVIDGLIAADGEIKTGQATLQTNLGTEVSERKNEITRVEGLISTETQNRNNALNDLDTTLRDLIGEEAGIRAAADVALGTRIDNEEKTRKADDEALQERATALETKTQNLDSSENTDGFYIIDNSTDKNVVAYANGTGIHAIDVYVDDYDADGNKQVASLRDVENRTVTLETWKISAQTALDNYGPRITMQENVTGETAIPTKTHKERLDDLETYVGSSGDSETSLNERLTTIETLVGTVNDESDVNTHEGRIKANLNSIIDLQTKVENVSNVMDFIGVFPKLSNLYAYESPNKGDVAVVTDLATEYVYDGKNWVEIGNSTATSTAISNLQAVVGHTGDLNASESSHHDQLDDHKKRITSLENSWSGRSISVSASDDNIVDLTGSGGQDTVTISASHKKVAGDGKGATHTKITYDDYGHITGGSSPTTLSGYGITDAVNSTTYASNLQTLNDKNTTQDNSHKALSNSVNYLGEFTSAPSAGRGDIATINGALKRYNGSSWENFEGLSKKLYYLDGTESGVFYFTDKSDNVVAYVDANGISTTDITLNSLKKGSDGVWSVVTSGTANGNTQLASTLKDALNNISTLNTSVASLNTTITSTGVPKWNDKTSIKFKGDVSDKTISFDGSETATIEVDLQVKDDSHNHAITCSGSGDDVAITVENSTAQNNKVAFTVKHKDILTTTSYSSGTTATSKNHNADFSFKVPKITLDDLGHIKTISDVEMKLSAQKTLKFGTSGLSYDGSADKTIGEADIKAAGGVGATDYATAMSKKKDKTSSENTKSVSGTNTFITSITQNTNGDITKVGSSTVDFSAVNASISTINANITNLQTWQNNWDAKAGVDIDDKIYFVDKNNNTIAYFDNDGLTVTNINLRTPNVPSGETANAIGQSSATMIFFQSKGAITVNDSIL